MAEFCEKCNQQLFGMASDFIGLTTLEDWHNGLAAAVLCESCGPILVDPAGV